MGKKKSHKKFSSSNENPFNVKINRNKHSVLGQKVRGTRGLPGVSHSIGNAKRKEMFHKKKIQSQKANKFLDKRLLNNSQSYEDEATARLIQERKKRFKKNIFNLNDEETLTHKGMPLLGDKSLNDEVIDSEDEEQLDSKFVKQAHFGGFTGESTAVPKTRKEIIDELIIESKRKKQERKLAREINADLIEKIDQEWKEKHMSMPLMKAGKTKELPVKNDPFDVLLQELKFEMRAAPTSRLKTPEEIASEEYDKKKKLEEERNKRMLNPMDISESVDNMLSADSIYDGLDIQFTPVLDEVSGGNEEVSDSSDNEESDDSMDANSNDNKLNMEDNDDSHPITSGDAPEIPDSIDKFCSVVDNHEEELYVVIDNILRCYVKNKTKQNLEKLESFFAILIEYALKSNSSKAFQVLDCILPHLYTLAEISPLNTALKLLAFFDKEQELFQQSKGMKKKQNFPRFQCLILFKFSSVIYSVSDFKHPVVTPALIFMCDILSSGYIITFQNILTRLYVCKIIYDCVSYSKSYVSEVIWFLNKTLELATVNKKKFNLHINEAVSSEERTELNFEKAEQVCDDNMKISIIYEVTELLYQYSLLYSEVHSYREIFSSALQFYNNLPIEKYPNFLKESISKFCTCVESIKKTYKPLVFRNQKPVPLKLFEPAFDSKYTIKKDDIRKKRKLIKNVEQKIRKEEKGLLREMRRDNQVIAAEKLRERIEADDERKRKVKQLYQELAMQEGEFKKFIKK